MFWRNANEVGGIHGLRRLSTSWECGTRSHCTPFSLTATSPPGGTCCFITVWFVLIVSGPTRGGLGLICISWMEANEFGRRLIARLFRWNWAVPSCAAQFLFKTKKFKREISQTSETHRFTCRTDWNEFKKKNRNFFLYFSSFCYENISFAYEKAEKFAYLFSGRLISVASGATVTQWHALARTQK